MLSVPVSNRWLLLVPVLMSLIGQMRNYGILLSLADRGPLEKGAVRGKGGSSMCIERVRGKGQ